MGRINTDDIIGLEFRNVTLICRECITKAEWINMTEDETIVEDDDDDLKFCDRCKERF